MSVQKEELVIQKQEFNMVKQMLYKKAIVQLAEGETIDLYS